MSSPFSISKSNEIRIAIIKDNLNTIELKKYSLMYSFYIECTEQDDPEDTEMDQNVSFQTMEFFINTFLNNAIFYNPLTLDKPDILEFDNNYVALPDLNEGSIAFAIYRKLNAIAEESAVINFLSIEDLVTEVTFELEGEPAEIKDVLPTTKEWLGKWSFWDEPWWERKDVMTFDDKAGSRKEYKEWMANREEMSDNVEKTLNNFKLALKGQILNNPSIQQSSGEVIDVDFNRKTWKPEIV